MKIVTIVGARPQFIKAAALSRVFCETDNIKEIMLHTGQHYDSNMSDIFFNELDIPAPSINLNINNSSHGKMTGAMLDKIEQVLLQEKPDWVLVYGDTNSTLAGALAAVKLHIRVAHIEAGLRSFNRKMPEEINRILTDHASDLLFTPTLTATQNLQHEGVDEKRIIQAGDIMYDAALFFGEKAERTSSILENLSLQSGKYILSTIHRAENTDNIDRLKIILSGLLQVSKKIKVVLPLHPRTKAIINQQNLAGLIDGLKIIDPVGYLDMIMLEKHAKLIATDSGGVQKEAFFYERPCAILRDETEWVELIELGWNYLVPMTGAKEVSDSIFSFLDNKGRSGKPYGDGKTARIIADSILNTPIEKQHG